MDWGCGQKRWTMKHNLMWRGKGEKRHKDWDRIVSLGTGDKYKAVNEGSCLWAQNCFRLSNRITIPPCNGESRMKTHDRAHDRCMQWYMLSLECAASSEIPPRHSQKLGNGSVQPTCFSSLGSSCKSHSGLGRWGKQEKPSPRPSEAHYLAQGAGLPGKQFGITPEVEGQQRELRTER